MNEDTQESNDQAGIDFFEKSFPSDRSENGPYDESEANPARPYVDLGGVKIIPREGLHIRMEVEEKTQKIVAVGLDYAESTLQIQPFAAPRTGGLWHEVRNQIAEQITRQGGRVQENEGNLGLELQASVPISLGGTRMVRFIGVDGPRWFLRGVIAGQATHVSEAAHGIEDLFRSIVVVRGNVPRPPRDLIPLRIPNEEAPVASAYHQI